MSKDAGQVWVNAEVNVTEALTFIDELDGYGLVFTDPGLLGQRLRAFGLADDEEE